MVSITVMISMMRYRLVMLFSYLLILVDTMRYLLNNGDFYTFRPWLVSVRYIWKTFTNQPIWYNATLLLRVCMELKKIEKYRSKQMRLGCTYFVVGRVKSFSCYDPPNYLMGLKLSVWIEILQWIKIWLVLVVPLLFEKNMFPSVGNCCLLNMLKLSLL